MAMGIGSFLFQPINSTQTLKPVQHPQIVHRGSQRRFKRWSIAWYV
jgi:hypothetical protein